MTALSLQWRHDFLLGVAAIFLSAVVCAVFYFGLPGGFLLDDIANLLRNANLQSARLDDPDSILYAIYSFQAGGGTRSMAMLSFVLDLWRGGLDPAVFKTTNIALHIATAGVLTLLLARLLRLAWPTAQRTHWAALAIAAVWALHPLHVSTVLYIVQRMQMLSALFVLLALLAYLHARQAQIAGQSGRRALLLTLLFWGLAFLGKEDAVLLPLYTALFEIVMLHFRAASPSVAKAWRSVYLALLAIGLLGFLFVALPRFWTDAPYPGRDFNTAERLLTQARVLLLYLSQSLLPLPDRMPFYYDHYPVSRGWLSPPSTLAAILFVVALLAYAWLIRRYRPLQALGIGWYFVGHALTSNIIGLELVFEHRNYLPLVGVILVVADFMHALLPRLPSVAQQRIAVVAAVLPLAALASLCAFRAHLWADPVRLAEHITRAVPASARGWVDLCNLYYKQSEGRADHPMLQRAIDTCIQGDVLGISALPHSNVVIYKALQGTLTDADWQHLLDRLRSTTITPAVKQTVWTYINNSVGETKIYLDPDRVAEVIDTIAARTGFSARDYLNIAYYLHNYTSRPEQALRYMRQVIITGKAGDPAIRQLLTDLDENGYAEWASGLRQLAASMNKIPPKEPNG